jgi:hypothetical protein
MLAAAWLFSGVRAVRSEDPGGRAISLETVFLTEPVGRTRGITIVGRAPGDAKVTLDPNMCALDVFGDRTICTQIAPMTVDVEVVQIRLADNSSQGRAIYALRGALRPEGSRWYLVGPPRGGAHYRLVVETGDDERRPITLEPRRGKQPDSRGARRPGLCSNVKYRAEQAGGTVTVYARGSHPTAGYQVRFEQLPIEIFPPQYRLLCIKPTGIVAQVVTPFEEKTSFRAGEPIKYVFVHDADGKHEVPVKQSP